MMRWATSGERYAAPPGDGRMPAINSRGSPDLSTNPLDTEAQSLGNELILGERGQHDHRGAGCHPAELLSGGQSVETRHPDVEQGDVRPVSERQFDGLAPVSGLGDHLQPRIRGQDGANADPDHRLVVGQQHTDHPASVGSPRSGRVFAAARLPKCKLSAGIRRTRCDGRGCRIASVPGRCTPG